MAGGFDDADFPFTQREHVTLVQQSVELAAVGGHVVKIENFRERLLHVTNAASAGDFRPGPVAQIVGRGQVVGVGMGLQHPFDLTCRTLGSGQHFIDKRGACHSADRIVNPARVDDRGSLALEVGQQMRPGTGIRLIE